MIKILSWNANGLLKHQQELQVFLETENIDICLISETHFTNESYIRFKGYKSYHTTHPSNSARGGSAIIIKGNLSHYESQHYKCEEIQATNIILNCEKYSLTVSSIYCPPRHQLKQSQYESLFQCLGNRFILGGDFNAKNIIWGSRLTSTKGKELYKAIEELKCQVHSTHKPTYWPTDPDKIPDVIDFFITKNISSYFVNIEECYDLNSDHSPILLTLSENITFTEINNSLANKNTNWVGFKEYIENNIILNVSIKTHSEIDYEVENLNKIIQNAAWLNTPSYKKHNRTNIYPSEIRNLLQEKRRSRRRWQQTRSPEDKKLLNNLGQNLKRAIQTYKNESFTQFLHGLTNEESTNYSLWRVTKKFKKSSEYIPPIKMQNNQWARSNQQKTDCFAEYLEQIFSCKENQNNKLDKNPTMEDKDIKFATIKEVYREIEALNSKKSPGYDLINGVVLKHLPRKGVLKITNIINASFRLQYMPQLWKVADVIMIPKPGKAPTEVTSYRPISLLPVISKIFERIFLARLKPIIEDKHLIPNHQFGFREQHSTIDQIHRITNVIENSLEEKKSVLLYFSMWPKLLTKSGTRV